MTTTSVSLLRQATDPSCADAWQRIVDLYAPMLRMWAKRAGLSVEEAADVAQDVLATLVKELPSFEYDRTKGTFRGWLKTITNNRCRERLRRRRAMLATDAEHALESPELTEFWNAEYEQYLMRRAGFRGVGYHGARLKVRGPGFHIIFGIDRSRRSLDVLQDLIQHGIVFWFFD